MCARTSGPSRRKSLTVVSRTCIVMVYIVMACIVLVYISLVMAYTFMAYIVMAYINMDCIVMVYAVMAYISMTYVIMAYLCGLHSYNPHNYGLCRQDERKRKRKSERYRIDVRLHKPSWSKCGASSPSPSRESCHALLSSYGTFPSRSSKRCASAAPCAATRAMARVRGVCG